ncbi:hypothetical protein L6452_36186 [Arctium lappa]|uniref:Uncharacterized protein n=1 Tax=Arctium lappa TaxID=4217 RepID=A0ACB8Y908_ARCLA|nr:hypothetical protein L6452_36186 [Arctium lappa]
MASHSISSKNSNGSKNFNKSHHSTAQKADSNSIEQEQFWLSARHAKMEEYGHCIIGYATHPSTTKILDLGINRRKLSDVYEVPTKADLNMRKFSEDHTEEEILEFMKFIGYAVPITKRTNFRKQNLPPLWNVFFSILNRCLTSKVGSPDQSNYTILAIIEEGAKDYIRGHRTPEPSPATPPRVGFQVGDVVIYLRDEKERETEVVATEAQVVVKSSEKKKRRKLRTFAERERSAEAKVETLSARSEPAEGGDKPLQKTRKTTLVFEETLEETPEVRPQSPLKLASEIAREVILKYSGDLGKTVALEIEDVTGKSQSEEEEEENKKSKEGSRIKDALSTQPKPTPHATHTTTSAVLVQKGIEEGPHSPIPTQAIWTEDIPSSSVPPKSGETIPTSPSQKGEGVFSVHLPQDTSLPHTEAFVASVTHISDHPTASELAEKEHNNDSFVEHRGLEGNPPNLNIILGFEGAKHSLAKSGTCVVPEVTSDTFITKSEFKAFVVMVFQKFDELKSSVTKESQANSQALAEALKANAEALKALHQSLIQHSAEIKKLAENSVARADLQACGKTIIAYSDQIQVLGDICMEGMGNFAPQVVQSGVDDLTKLRDEIKDITRSVIVPFQP